MENQNSCSQGDSPTENRRVWRMRHKKFQYSESSLSLKFSRSNQRGDETTVDPDRQGISHLETQGTASHRDTKAIWKTLQSKGLSPLTTAWHPPRPCGGNLKAPRMPTPVGARVTSSCCLSFVPGTDFSDWLVQRMNETQVRYVLTLSGEEPTEYLPPNTISLSNLSHLQHKVQLSESNSLIFLNLIN